MLWNSCYTSCVIIITQYVEKQFHILWKRLNNKRFTLVIVDCHTNFAVFSEYFVYLRKRIHLFTSS